MRAIAGGTAPKKKLKKKYTLPQGPRGDAPQTRTQDMARANAYKAKPVYKKAVARAGAPRRAAAVRTGMSDADRKRAEDYKRTPQYQRDLQAARPKKDDRNLFEKVAGAIVHTSGVGLGIEARHKIEDNTGKTGRAIRKVDRQLTKEAEGRGQAVKLSKRVADLVGNTSTVSTGGGPGTLGATRGKRQRGGGAATILASPQAVKINKAGVVGRGLKDLVNFPAQVIPSAYVPAAGVVEAAQGNPQRLKKFKEDVKATDPIYNLATGHPKKALKLVDEHPGFAALEVAGVKGTIGRGAGRAMRVVPGPTRKLASTTRAPKTYPGTDLRQERAYSPDVTRKARQVATEKIQAKRARKIREKAAQSTDVETADALHVKANKVDPHRMSDTEVRKRVDERVAVNETIRRQNRTIATNEALKAVRNKGGRKAKRTAAQSLVAQNIVKASREDLTRYRDELRSESSNLEGARLRANRLLRNQIDAALKKGGDMKAVGEAARRYSEDVTGPRTKKLVQRGMLSPAEANGVLKPYAVRNMGMKFENGEMTPAQLEQIRAHMAANGVKEPAYVTQAPSQRGARNFYVSSSRPPSVGGGPRTGVATKQGTFDAHPDTLTEGAARAQGLIDAADGFTATIKEFASRGGSGKVKTFANKKHADNAVRDAFAKDGTRLRAVRVNPWGGRQEQLKALLDRANGDEPDARVGSREPVKEALESAVRGEDGQGPWTLIPEAAADQLNQHLSRLTAGPGGKALQVLSGQFRKTVLATSPTWFAGNITEAGLRSGVGRAGPRSYMTGRRVVKALERKDPMAARELSARAIGGGHYSMADRTTIHRDAGQFEGNRVLEPTARALGAFWRAPGPKQVAGVWHAWTDLVFRAVNGRIETQFQTAMLGKTLRDSNLMNDRLVKLSRKAIDEAAEGLRDTNTQARFAREVERMYGKYQGFSPGTRGMIAMYTPFIAWTLNAVKFVYDVLPRDHPTLTALTVATERATEEWRKQHGLDLFMQDAVPGFLQGSIPTKGGGHQRAPNRFTPFGAFGDPLATVAGAVLPQASGVLAAFKGQDWTGRPLKDPSFAGRSKAAAQSFLESTVPIVAQAKRVNTKGLNALNPLAEVKPKKSTGRAVKRSPASAIDSALDRTDRIDRALDRALGGY